MSSLASAALSGTSANNRKIRPGQKTKTEKQQPLPKEKSNKETSKNKDASKAAEADKTRNNKNKPENKRSTSETGGKKKSSKKTTAKEIMQTEIRALAVSDKQGNIPGLVTVLDIFRALLKTKPDIPNPDKTSRAKS